MLRGIVCLVFLHGAVIIDEHKGALIIRVVVALGALVARAEVTLFRGLDVDLHEYTPLTTS